MSNRSWPILFIAAASLTLVTPQHADAKGIMLITRGDTVSEIGDQKGKLSRKTMSGKVGYKYSYFGLFWIDFWTYDGTYCTFAGDTFDPLTPAEAATLLGKKESDLSTPFSYKVPLGWLIVGGILLLVVLGAVLKKKPQPDATPTANDV